MKNLDIRHRTKRHLLGLLALWPWVSGCAESVDAAGNGSDVQARFKGIGLVLVVDAVPSAEMEGVEFFDDRNVWIYASSLTAKRNRAILALGGRRVPITLRVIWRDNPKPVRRTTGAGGTTYEGVIVGDYTIPIAERIPEEVLKSIRKQGGALRLKFRLKPDGVLFGWDIERRDGDISKFDMPGGDFLDTKY